MLIPAVMRQMPWAASSGECTLSPLKRPGTSEMGQVLGGLSHFATILTCGYLFRHFLQENAGTDGAHAFAIAHADAFNFKLQQGGAFQACTGEVAHH